jgi:hypothetical protein
MKEIKSVRVRRSDIKSGTLDIKVTIYEERRTFGADERILVGYNNDRPVWIETTYKKKDIYKEFTDDQFITDFIDMNARSEGGGKEYEIIQDPWENKVPVWRKYGFDPYYLNNGAQIFIQWNEGNMVSGGLTYSDDRGKEINTTSLIDKTNWIVGIDDPSKEQNYLLHFTKNNEIDYRKKTSECKVYGGLVTDLYIIQEVIEAWKRKVPGYDTLALCSPNNESCSVIPYKSPLKPPEPEAPPTVKVAVNEPPKEKMTVVLPPDVVKVKSDITSFVVYVGKGKEKSLLENPSTESDEFVYDDSPGIDEYTESDFIGEEEAKWEPLKDVEDDTFDPDEDKGAGGDETPTPESFVPATQTQKDFIKTAVKATLSQGEKHGKCARFTFNHVNNYVRLMQGKSVEQGSVHSAGGNANDSGYHKNLQSMGYKIISNESISKSSLINKISTGAWSVGDVIVYWCTDGPSNASHVKYGHTQIFTNGYHNDSSYRWSTDNMNNYKCSFVYRTKAGDSYKFIHFQAPKTKKLNDVA